MAKDTFYFSHDYNARNDEKILELRANYGAEGYGIFWMIVEAMAEGSSGGLKASHIGGLALGFGLPKHKLLEIVNFCLEIKLFFEKEESYYSQRLLTHKQFRDSLSKWGKIGAEKRKGSLSPPTSPPDTKERKGKESNINTNSDFVCYDAEKYVLEDQSVFERICMATGKEEEEVKTEIHKYHLWMAKKEKYPIGKKAIEAGIESWIIESKNFKNYNNGQHSTGTGAKLGTSDARIEKLRNL